MRKLVIYELTITNNTVLLNSEKAHLNIKIINPASVLLIAMAIILLLALCRKTKEFKVSAIFFFSVAIMLKIQTLLLCHEVKLS
jgi:hypothetical protein